MVMVDCVAPFQTAPAYAYATTKTKTIEPRCFPAKPCSAQLGSQFSAYDSSKVSFANEVPCSEVLS